MILIIVLIIFGIFVKAVYDAFFNKEHRKKIQPLIDEKIRINKSLKEDMSVCPYCGSHNVQLVTSKSTFSCKKAFIGNIFLLGYGTLAGVLGNSKIEHMCVKCGKKW